MKKIVYILLFTSILTFSLTSCTEENVTPTDSTNGGGQGGNAGDPKGN